MDTNKVYRNLPDGIKTILLTSEGWLVGSAVEGMLADSQPRDFDIIVTNRELFQVVLSQLAIIADGMRINSFGGFKVTLREEEITYEVDIWCEELSHFIVNCNRLKYIYNYKKQILIKKED